MASVFKPAGKSKYRIEYTDENGRRRKATSATDKAVTERIAADLENKFALCKAGIIDPKAEAYRDHGTRPLSGHIADWVKALEAKGATPKHVELFTGRARRIVALLLGAKLSEIEPPKNAKRTDIPAFEVTLSKWVGDCAAFTHDRRASSGRAGNPKGGRQSAGHMQPP
jgi:hypothetical protein